MTQILASSHVSSEVPTPDDIAAQPRRVTASGYSKDVGKAALDATAIIFSTTVNRQSSPPPARSFL